jgi:hypothetical protein
MTAVLADDGEAFGDFAMTVYLDSEEFTVPDGDRSPCDFIDTFGFSYTACDAEDTREECMTVALDDGTAALVEFGV